MSFLNLTLKHSYNSEQDDLLNDFYIPVLQEASTYRRVTGYFSSTSFAVAATGLAQFVKNGGHMQFILNVRLTEGDYEQIEKSTQSPESLIASRILEDLERLEGEFVRNHARALGWLIANDFLDLRIGYIKDKKCCNDIFHQKVGILEDGDGNVISFSGSNNESAYGWQYNSEQFKVFCSWKQGNAVFVNQDIENFNELWQDNASKTKVISFPDAVKKQLIETAPAGAEEVERILESGKNRHKGPRVVLREYQQEAINAWFAHECRGIFEMATGTGKTFAALGALRQLYDQEKKLITVISCPFLHLSQQWERSIHSMQLNVPIVLASTANTHWQHDVVGKGLDQRLGKCNQFIIITTHATLSTPRFIAVMSEMKAPIFLIADEVHGLGAPEHSNGLLSVYDYRLGLSATPERYYDEVGTAKLLEYFKGTVYTFCLHRAINEINPDTGETFLVPYDYHPIIVDLEFDELEEYVSLSTYIATLVSIENRSKDEDLRLERKLMERQDILKNADRKYLAFRDLITRMVREGDISHTLTYCSPKQISIVQSIIREQGHIVQHRFTSHENATKRKEEFNGKTERGYLLDNFDKGTYQVLVAIRCLDEGVDVPSTKNAILLCSSGNPREYIQRRGRILRRYPGKEKAVIYDILALPNPKEHRIDEPAVRNIIDSQFKRLEEFAQDSRNEAEALREIFGIKKAYLPG
jgi:superfamily II DNA or RNA helicase